MKWNETTANTCRYGGIAASIWGDWDVIWEDSEADYQGHASFIAKKDGKYCFYEWWYGSCSGCDGWEAAGYTDEQIEKEMRDTAMWLSSEEALKRWLGSLEGGNPVSNYSMDKGGGLAAGIDILGGGLLGRINAIRKEFGMPPYSPKPTEKKEENVESEPTTTKSEKRKQSGDRRRNSRLQGKGGKRKKKVRNVSKNK